MLTLARVCVFGRFETYIDVPPQLVAPVLDSGDASLRPALAADLPSYTRAFNLMDAACAMVGEAPARL